jgi:hypothetical protein
MAKPSTVDQLKKENRALQTELVQIWNDLTKEVQHQTKETISAIRWEQLKAIYLTTPPSYRSALQLPESIRETIISECGVKRLKEE